MGKLEKYSRGIDAFKNPPAPAPAPEPDKPVELDNEQVSAVTASLVDIAERVEKAIGGIEAVKVEGTDLKPVEACLNAFSEQLRDTLAYWGASTEGAHKDAAKALADSFEKGSKGVADSVEALTAAQDQIVGAINNLPREQSTYLYEVRRTSEGLIESVVARPVDEVPDNSSISVE